MKSIVNTCMRPYLAYRYKALTDSCARPSKVQQFWLHAILSKSAKTQYANVHGLSHVKTYSDFSKALPIVNYEMLFPWIEKMMHGANDILWPGRIQWFSKSSGTSNGKSKFIPLSAENIRFCHIKGTWDTLCNMYHHRPESMVFQYKTLMMGGAIESFEAFPGTKIGDVSAIMIKHMPLIARPFFTPDVDLALEKEWEAKLEKMAQVLAKEKDMVMIGGVPTWTLVLLKRILEITGKDNMLDVWPRLSTYAHGGVGFAPYAKAFKQLIPKKIDYINVYNASEGYFAMQDCLDRPEKNMLLLPNNGIFYEFIPMDSFYNENPQAIPLWEVQKDIDYALVITNNSGLWRYVVGDTIRFTDLKPYRIQITGRTSQYINVFGEEVMVHNVEKALEIVCSAHECQVSDFTVAPRWLTNSTKGGHEWLIEFTKAPLNLKTFEEDLDLAIQSLNSDYQAKRYKSIALLPLKLHSLRQGTFHDWLKTQGKYGGQHKVVRLSNDRKIFESIRLFHKHQGELQNEN